MSVSVFEWNSNLITLFLISGTSPLVRLLVAEGFHCCNSSLSLSHSFCFCFFSSFSFLPICSRSLIPLLILPQPHLSFSSSSYFVHPPAPWPSLPRYPLLTSLSLSHRCYITPHSLSPSLSFSLSPIHLLSALSFALPARRQLSVLLPRQSNNWLLSALGEERERWEWKTTKKWWMTK